MQNKKKIGFLTAIAALIVLGVLVMTGIYRCPFKMLFKIPCPLCGMTRALKCAVQFKMREAFAYHPLWPLVPAVFLIETLRQLKVIRLSAKVYNIAAVVLALLVLVCYIVRLVTKTYILI